MSRSVYQHFIPKVYLKHFAIDSFVHVYKFTDPYRKNIQRKGIGDKMFCRKLYYDFTTNGKQHIEQSLSNFERHYNTIIQRLENKSILNYDTKQLIINWLHISKIRSTYFRDQMSDLISWAEKTKYGLQHGAKAMKTNEEDFINKGKIIGKRLQLDNFINKELYEETKKAYSFSFLSREWTILISNNCNFITNDNPGFSYTIDENIMRLNLSPISTVFNLSSNGVITHLFPLSPTMCLSVKNFLWPSNVSEEEMQKDIIKDITFEIATPDFVDLINKATIDSSHSIVISRSSEDLKKYIPNKH